MRVLLAAAVALALAASATRAQEALPTIEIAPGVHVHQGAQEEASADNEGAIANLGFIVGDDAVLVVDPGGSAREGARLRAAIRAVTDRPVRYVVLSHVHPDHIFGAASFAPDAPVFIGHAKLPGALAQRGAYYLRALRRTLGAAAERSEIVAPTLVVEKTMELELGGRRAEIRAHGPAHTDNDLSVLDRRTGTLFLADLLFVERIPVIDGSVLGWLRELEALKAVAAARAVPGHGPAVVAWPQAAERQERYLRAVVAGTRKAIAEHVDIAAAPRVVALDERAEWPLFDEYHARNVTAAYKELEWE
jgi:quinoprotein relay system zinc metallohydrolase 2